VNITYKTNPPLTSADLNALFSAGRDAPETSDWQPVLAHSLVYLCAYDGGRLIGFANVAWDGRVHAFLLDPRVHPDWRHRNRHQARRARGRAMAAGCTVLHVDFRDDLAPFYFDSCSQADARRSHPFDVVRKVAAWAKRLRGPVSPHKTPHIASLMRATRGRDARPRLTPSPPPLHP
jgi:hypothetical protein